MTDTIIKMLKTAQTLDKLIIDTTLDVNKKWQKKNQMLGEAHKSLHEVIDTLILMGIAEGLGQENIASELTDETEDD
jgi:hypothetical protein